MLYFVEMDLADRSRIDAWNAWYRGHVRKLLAVPGFLAAQRFEAIGATASPFIAIYSIAGAEVLTSAAYRAKFGPDSAGEWRDRMTNWNRNLLEGIDELPEVSAEGWLAIMDRRTQSAPVLPPLFTPLRPCGLDRSIVERGLRVGAPAQDAPTTADHGAWSLRVCKPLSSKLTPGNQLTGASHPNP
jgi:hypothetical protein